MVAGTEPSPQSDNACLGPMLRHEACTDSARANNARHGNKKQQRQKGRANS
jgi:hypothetical protein